MCFKKRDSISFEFVVIGRKRQLNELCLLETDEHQAMVRLFVHIFFPAVQTPEYLSEVHVVDSVERN